MLVHAEHSLANDGVEFLQVKTLSASKWTRATSKREASTSPMGSDRLRSFQTSGTKENPAYQMVKPVTSVAVAYPVKPAAGGNRYGG